MNGPHLLCAGCGAETTLREPVCARCAAVVVHQAPTHDHYVECRSLDCGWEGMDSQTKSGCCPKCGWRTQARQGDG